MKRRITLVALLASAALIAGGTSAQATPVSRANAVARAYGYLDYKAFSLKGLIDQLRFEKYTTGDATYAATHVHANWMKEAALRAKDYLQYTAFSRDGLIEQLEFEGFTAAQAAYGATMVGL